MADNTAILWILRSATLAAAGLYTSVSEVSAFSDVIPSTVATAEPHSPSVVRAVVFDCQQHAKPLPGDVDAVTTFINRSFNSCGKIPPKVIHARPNKLYIYIDRAAQFCNRCSDSIVLDNMVISPVVALGGRSRPSAVSRRVVPIRIDSVKCSTIRSLSHVEVKHREVTPLIADLNTSPSIQGVSRSIRVRASLEHGYPRAICGRPAHAVSSNRFSVTDSLAVSEVW